MCSRRIVWAYVLFIGHVSIGVVGLPVNDTRGIESPQNLPRYALCLSGGSRTLQYTADRYIDLLRANPGTDVFVYLGLDNKDTGTSGQPAEIKAFLARREVVKAVFETVDPWTGIKAELGVSCANPDRNRMQSVLMQAHKIRMCQRLVDEHVASGRNGALYDLVIRSRPDLLLPPEPLNLTRVFSATEAALAQADNSGEATTRPQPTSRDTQATAAYNEARDTAKERSSRSNSGSRSSSGVGSTEGGVANSVALGATTDKENSKEPRGESGLKREGPRPLRALLVPLCCDWNGLNDQFAIGTHLAMRDYADRLSTWSRSHPAMTGRRLLAPSSSSLSSSSHPSSTPRSGGGGRRKKRRPVNGAGGGAVGGKKVSDGCEGDSDRHTLVNVLSRLQYTVVLRFYFEYALLRDKNVRAFLAEPNTYREHRSVVSAGANGLNRVVDVGAVCSRDPAAVAAAGGAKAVRRQRETSGKDAWTREDLKCAPFPSVTSSPS